MKYHRIFAATLLSLLTSMPTLLRAETEMRAVQRQSTGHYLVETAGDRVNFHPSMNVASRKSYRRSVNLYGIDLLHSTALWTFRYRFLTTKGDVRGQAYRHELLWLPFNGTEYRRGPRLDLQRGVAIDIAESWMGYASVLDSSAEAKLSERQHALEAFFSLSDEWSIGTRLSYTYNRYMVGLEYYPQRPYNYMFTPYYSGNTLTSNLYELQAGLAYKKDLSPFSLEFNFLPGVGRINARDLNQRFSTTARFDHADGFSLHTSVGVGLRLAGVTLHVNAFAHRLYGRTYRSEYTTMLTNGLPVQQPGADLNLKEGGYEFGIGYAF